MTDHNTSLIPSGVYYSAENDNFYRSSDRKGLGTAFYLQWRGRANEFPLTGGADPEQHTS